MFTVSACIGMARSLPPFLWHKKSSPEIARRVVYADSSVANVDTDVVKDHDSIQYFKHINAMVIKSKIKK